MNESSEVSSTFSAWKWSSVVYTLTFWVLAAIITGALLGHFSPEMAKKTAPLAKYFVDTVKLFIYPLVFLTVSLGIASMSDLRAVGKIGLKAILYFEVVTTIALLIGIGVAYLVRPGDGLIPVESAAVVEKYGNRSHDLTLLHFFSTNHTLQVLMVAILVGMALTVWDKKRLLARWLGDLLSMMFWLLRWFMKVAPVAAFAGMATTIGEHGLGVLWTLASLMLCVYGSMALFILVVLNGILRYYRVRLLQFLLLHSPRVTLGARTSSSEAALPQLMKKLEEMGCSKPVVGLVIPAGYSFNLDGTTLYLSLATIFLSQVYHVSCLGNNCSPWSAC